jgi:hypothetical protein
VQYIFWAVGLSAFIHTRRRLRTARQLEIEPFPRVILRALRRRLAGKRAAGTSGTSE